MGTDSGSVGQKTLELLGEVFAWFALYGKHAPGCQEVPCRCGFDDLHRRVSLALAPRQQHVPPTSSEASE